MKAPESSDEIPKGEDKPIPSGTKSSSHLPKAPSPQNSSPRTTILGLCPMENPQSSELAESPKTTPPNNPCHGISSTGEYPIGGNSAQPQPKSLPRRTPLVAKTLGNDPDFIQASFNIGRFITAMVDTEADRLNTELLQTELESTSTRINVTSPCIIVHYHLCSILTSPFRSEIN
jgi:hypothetical protein